MAIEDIRIVKFTVQEQQCEIFERVDVTGRSSFVDDDGRTLTRIAGDRLGYVVTGRGNGTLTIDSLEGFLESTDPSRGAATKEFLFASRRPADPDGTGRLPFMMSFP